MKRLTFYDGFNKPCYRLGNTVYSNKIAARLAAYEETGLEPEELKNLKTGIIPEHWGELFMAECEGRLLVLPEEVTQNA